MSPHSGPPALPSRSLRYPPAMAHVPETNDRYRFYGDLARWWPLISPVEDYEDEANEFVSLLGRSSRPVHSMLELGSGGGHIACHLKRHVTLTLTDISTEMLAISAQLNPECRHLAGDMRTVRLDEQFDAVFIHDAIDYMTTADDLGLAMATAYAHCRPGGIAIFVPDHVAETFEPSTECGGVDGPDGRGARYLEWSWDPDPADTTVITHYAFLLREADGTVYTASEAHVGGLFSQDVWMRLVAGAGFRPELVVERTDDPRQPRRVFIGHRSD